MACVERCILTAKSLFVGFRSYSSFIGICLYVADVVSVSASLIGPIAAICKSQLDVYSL